ncbi:DUF4136 domain-containing protein [Flammeovirgaceae bacterium SG7u.111]|nr:DUF4136 domain-containing protein [Flammeovirgaceae bacterium SG7u.132]WPO35316.1 DUF4136 domain-containing protein [Flammeovirgaceae bacterium SG7u.111]
MKAIRNFIFLVLLGITLSACNIVNVTSVTSDSSDFSAYQTYQFDKDAGRANSVLLQSDQDRIMELIQSEMEARGYEESSSPDILVDYFITIEDKVQKRESTIQDARMGYMGQRNYSWSASDSIVVSRYKEGSLVIDIIDAKKKNMVWEGTATAEVVKNRKNKEEFLQKVVSSIFSKFPHQASKAGE